MPTLAGVEVEARIRELVDHHRPELEQIVDVELDCAFDAIVVERIAARNGHDREPAKLCSNCHERPRVAGRTICSACKGRRDWQRQRERRAEQHAVAATVDDPPRANGSS